MIFARIVPCCEEIGKNKLLSWYLEISLTRDFFMGTRIKRVKSCIYLYTRYAYVYI